MTAPDFNTQFRETKNFNNIGQQWCYIKPISCHLWPEPHLSPRSSPKSLFHSSTAEFAPAISVPSSVLTLPRSTFPSIAAAQWRKPAALALWSRLAKLRRRRLRTLLFRRKRGGRRGENRRRECSVTSSTCARRTAMLPKRFGSTTRLGAMESLLASTTTTSCSISARRENPMAETRTV